MEELRVVSGVRVRVRGMVILLAVRRVVETVEAGEAEDVVDVEKVD